MCLRMTDRFSLHIILQNMKIIGGSPSIIYAYASRLGYMTVDWPCNKNFHQPTKPELKTLMCVRLKSNELTRR